MSNNKWPSDREIEKHLLSGSESSDFFESLPTALNSEETQRPLR